MNKTSINSTLATTLACLCLISSAAQATNPANEIAHSYEDGLSADELRNLVMSLPVLPGRILATLIFHEHGYSGSSVAIGTYDKSSGWQLFIFKPSKNKLFDLEWKSGKLEDTFSVGSPADLKLFFLEGEEAITFGGCAPHVCPDVFSFLLYVPSEEKAFTATSTWGKVTYSVELQNPENAEYKSALTQLIKVHIKDLGIVVP